MNNTYVTTITIVTVPFGHDESDERLLNLACAYMLEVERFFYDIGIADKTELEGYWERGCLIQRIIVRLVPILDRWSIDEQVEENNNLIATILSTIEKEQEQLSQQLGKVSSDTDLSRPSTALKHLAVNRENVTTNSSGKLGNVIEYRQYHNED